VLRAFLFNGGEAGADLDALHGVDAHKRVRDIGIQPVEHRLTETTGTLLATTLTRAPIELRSARMSSMNFSSSGIFAGSGEKKAFCSTASQSLSSSAIGPSCAR